MDKNTFLQPFNMLRDSWLPSLGLSLEAVQSPIVESNSYRTSAEFKVKVNVNSTVRGGNCGYNCSNQYEVDNEINTIAEIGCSGKSELLNNQLQHMLDNNSLLKLYNIGEFSLKDYTFSCLITCNNCNGRGTVTCGACGGSGTQQEAYQAHVKDNVTYQNGREVSRYPIYETRHRTVNCYSCNGSGRRTCGTCGGDGVNTYEKTACFYSSYENSMIHWTKFEKLPWVCKFIANRAEEQLDINETVDWEYAKQIIQENGAPGFYKVELPGTLTAAQCRVEATSPYSETTDGICFLLGGIPYDTDFIFDQHLHWSSSKNAKIPLTGEALTPILNNRLVEECVKDMNSEQAPYGDIRNLNMVRSDTVKSLQWLMNKLYIINKEQRDSISIWKLLLNSIFAGALLAAILFGFNSLDYPNKSLNFGLYPMIANMIEVIDIVFHRSISQVNGYLDLQMWIYLMATFIPAMILMKLFGSNKALTTRRMLKWYIWGSLFLCAFLMQFVAIEKEHLNVTANNVLFDFIVLSLLGGILWTRKGAFGRQKQYAKEFNSRRLMELLGYEEQK
tara:strand:+ start:740 stop:2419 length:1680 start_codon:yes stop_codon:yes gene_type:complete